MALSYYTAPTSGISEGGTALAPRPAPTAAPMPGATSGQAIVMPPGGLNGYTLVGSSTPRAPAPTSGPSTAPTAPAPSSSPVFGHQTDAGFTFPGVEPQAQGGGLQLPAAGQFPSPATPPAPPPSASVLGQNFTFQPFPVPNTTSVPATPVNFTPIAMPAGASPDLASLRAALMQQYGNLNTSPDRFALAQQRFGTYASQTDPYFQSALREGVGAAAGGGTLGSGMLNTSLGNITDTRALQLQGERDTLFQNALEGTIQDKLNNLAAGGGLFSGLSSADLQAAAQRLAAEQFNATGSTGAQEFNSQLQQQAAQSAFAQALARAQFGAQQNAETLASQQFGQQFQNQLSQEAFANEMAQMQEQAALQQQMFGQNATIAQLAGGFGFGNDPFSLQLLAGGQAAGQGAAGAGALQQNGASSALAQYLQQLQNGGGVPITGGQTPFGPIVGGNAGGGVAIPPVPQVPTAPTPAPPSPFGPSVFNAQPSGGLLDYTALPPRAASQPLAYSPLASLSY